MIAEAAFTGLLSELLRLLVWPRVAAPGWVAYYPPTSDPWEVAQVLTRLCHTADLYAPPNWILVVRQPQTFNCAVGKKRNLTPRQLQQMAVKQRTQNPP